MKQNLELKNKLQEDWQITGATNLDNCRITE